MNDKFFKEMKDLGLLVAKRIDKICRKYNVNQILASKLFIEVYKLIIDSTEKDLENKE